MNKQKKKEKLHQENIYRDELNKIKNTKWLPGILVGEGNGSVRFTSVVLVLARYRWGRSRGELGEAFF